MARPMARWTNMALLALVPLALISGLVINLIGVDLVLDPRVVHGIIGFAIVALTPWKSVVVAHGLEKKRSRHLGSILLLVVVAACVVSGFVQTLGGVNRLGPITLMQIHVGSGILAFPLLLIHYRSHPIRPRAVDLDRRTALRALTLSAGAVLAWIGWEGGLRAVGAPGADRRFTGSHERGSLSPAAMPTTSWLDDVSPSISPDNWRLTIGDTHLTHGDLVKLPQETFEATLDCTSGWYSRQLWTGIRLDQLIEDGDWTSFEVRSATGYTRRYPITDLSRTWVALGVGGEPLSRGHGFPARLVAPGRRGFWWVKWVVAVTPSNRPAWQQSPFPLT